MARATRRRDDPGRHADPELARDGIRVGRRLETRHAGGAARRRRLLPDRRAKPCIFRERDPTGADPPYTLEVVTLTSETPDPAAVEAALRRQKPAGHRAHVPHGRRLGLAAARRRRTRRWTALDDDLRDRSADCERSPDRMLDRCRRRRASPCRTRPPTTTATCRAADTGARRPARRRRRHARPGRPEILGAHGRTRRWIKADGRALTAGAIHAATRRADRGRLAVREHVGQPEAARSARPRRGRLRRRPGLTARAAGQAGGAESHVLTEAQMPTHTHGYDRSPRTHVGDRQRRHAVRRVRGVASVLGHAVRRDCGTTAAARATLEHAAVHGRRRGLSTRPRSTASSCATDLAIEPRTPAPR